MNTMQTNIQTPHLETILADIAPAENPIREAANATRGRLRSLGRFGRVHFGIALAAISIVLFAACAFAAPGLIPGVLAMMAAAALIAGVYYALEFDPTPLRAVLVQYAGTAEDQLSNLLQPKIAGLAGELVVKVQNDATKTAAEFFGAGGPLQSVRSGFDLAAQASRELERQLGERHLAACRYSDSMRTRAEELEEAFARRARPWWPTRLIPGYTRIAAGRWLSAIENLASARLDQAVTKAAGEAARVLAEWFGEQAAIYGGTESELAALKLKATNCVSAMTGRQNGTGCSKSLPLPEEVMGLAAALVNQEIVAIQNRIANRSPEITLVQAVEMEANRMAEAIPLPKTLGEFWSRRNGDKQQLISQFIELSRPFGVSDNPPGHAPLTFQMLMVPGGEESDLAKDLKRQSDGVTIRAFDHDKAHEAVALTERQFVSVAHMPEYLRAVRILANFPPDKVAPMIVATETDAAILSYSPETGHDSGRTLRLLALGLALEIIERTGAETYRLRDADDPKAPYFSKGFEAALEKVANDRFLAQRLETEIQKAAATLGGDNLRVKLIAAKGRGLVPSAFLKQYRAVLQNEIDRLASVNVPIAA
jgi:hypothetical protein